MPILMIHGYGIDHHVMEDMFERIEGIDSFQRIYIDLPHMGLTQNIECNNSDDYLKILIEFCNEYIKEEFLVAGFSYGGYLAAALENKLERVKGIISICPVVEPAREDRIVADHKVFHQDEFCKSLENEGFVEGCVIQTKEVYERSEKVFTDAFKKSNGDKLSEIFRNGYRLSENPYKVQTESPCLLLLGKHDSTVGYQDALNTVDRYKNLTVGLLNQAGHALPLEQQELFESHVKVYLKEVLR